MSGKRRVFYRLSDGEVILEVGRGSGMIIPTIEEDIKTYKALSTRNRDTFGYLELPFEMYQQDFIESSGYRVNLGTKKLEFFYSEDTTQPAQPPLSESVQALADENADLLMQNAMQDVSITALQDENAALMMRLAMLEMGGTANV